MTTQRPITIQTERGEMRGYLKDATEVIRPDQPTAVEAIFTITHFDHFCIYCGKQGLVHLLGTFVSPVDGLEYPFCVCEDHEPRKEPSDQD